MILYVGCYSEMITPEFGGRGDGIYCYDFDEKTGILHYKNISIVRNPSYLCIDQSNRFLYVIEEVVKEKNPIINAFAIQADHSLQLINQQPIQGGLPCHLDFVNNHLLAVACYETGHVMTYPIAEDGRLQEASFTTRHEGSSINLERQESAHAHVIVPESLGKVAVCDLGMDQILFYESTEFHQLRIQKEKTISIPAGHGPRHLAFHPEGKYGFVSNELTATVSVLKRSNDELWELKATIAALPPSYSGTPSASAIRVHPSGRFVYSGNRGHDSIAIFHFDEKNGILELVGHQSTFGRTPREFNLTPDGQWLLVANQDSDFIVVFKVNLEDGSLQKYKKYDVKSPVCLKWSREY